MHRNEHRRGWGGQSAKLCAGCRKYRLLKFFWSNTARWDGKSHRCVFCEKMRGKVRAQTNPEYARTYSRIWRAANPHKRKEYELKTVYGITTAQYNEFLVAQGNVCAICQRAEIKQLRGKLVRLAVDHDHKTDKVRGLLCQSCNHGIGNLRDDPRILQQAIRYLESAR